MSIVLDTSRSMSSPGCRRRPTSPRRCCTARADRRTSRRRAAPRPRPTRSSVTSQRTNLASPPAAAIASTASSPSARSAITTCAPSAANSSAATRRGPTGRSTRDQCHLASQTIHGAPTVVHRPNWRPNDDLASADVEHPRGSYRPNLDVIGRGAPSGVRPDIVAVQEVRRRQAAASPGAPGGGSRGLASTTRTRHWSGGAPRAGDRFSYPLQ